MAKLGFQQSLSDFRGTKLQKKNVYLRTQWSHYMKWGIVETPWQSSCSEQIDDTCFICVDVAEHSQKVHIVSFVINNHKLRPN